MEWRKTWRVLYRGKDGYSHIYVEDYIEAEEIVERLPAEAEACTEYRCEHHGWRMIDGAGYCHVCSDEFFEGLIDQSYEDTKITGLADGSEYTVPGEWVPF